MNKIVIEDLITLLTAVLGASVAIHYSRFGTIFPNIWVSLLNIVILIEFITILSIVKRRKRA